MMQKVIMYVLISIVSMNGWSTDLTAGFSGPENSELTKNILIWLQEVGELADLSFTLELMPLDRSKKRLLEGSIDLDIGRSIYVYPDSSEVIYIDTPIIYIDYLIYSKRKVIIQDSGSQLNKWKGGVNIGDKRVKAWYNEHNIFNLVSVNTSEHLFNLLNYNRIDYLIAPSVYKLLIHNNPDYNGILNSNKPIFIDSAYLVIHKKHKDLIPKLNYAINVMNKSGRTRELFP